MKKKSIKKIMIVLPVILIVCVVVFSSFTNVFGVSTEFPTTTKKIEKLSTGAEKIWGSVLTIMQFVAFGAIVYSGIKYMFASAEAKADIKKSLGILALGAIIVFAASTVVKFLVGAAGQVIS